MLFPTFTFACFFLVVLVVHWSIHRRPVAWRFFILGASYVFYGYWDWRFSFLLAGSTLGNQLFAVGHLPGPRRTGPPGPGHRRGGRSTSPYSASSSTTTSSPRACATRSDASACRTRRCCTCCCRSGSRSSRSRRCPTCSTCGAASCARSACSTSPSTCRSSPTSWPGRSCGPRSSCPSCGGVVTRRRVDLTGRHVPHRRRAVQEGRHLLLRVGQHRRPGLRRARPPLRPRRRCSASTATPCRSTPTSPATPTSPSASPCCSASGSPRTSTAPTAPRRSRTSGDAGT